MQVYARDIKHGLVIVADRDLLARLWLANVAQAIAQAVFFSQRQQAKSVTITHLNDHAQFFVK